MMHMQEPETRIGRQREPGTYLECDPASEIEQREPAYQEGRNSKTLVKFSDMRVVLSAIKGGHRIGKMRGGAGPMHPGLFRECGLGHGREKDLQSHRCALSRLRQVFWMIDPKMELPSILDAGSSRIVGSAEDISAMARVCTTRFSR